MCGAPGSRGIALPPFPSPLWWSMRNMERSHRRQGMPGTGVPHPSRALLSLGRTWLLLLHKYRSASSTTAAEHGTQSASETCGCAKPNAERGWLSLVRMGVHSGHRPGLLTERACRIAWAASSTAETSPSAWARASGCARVHIAIANLEPAGAPSAWLKWHRAGRSPAPSSRRRL